MFLSSATVEDLSSVAMLGLSAHGRRAGAGREAQWRRRSFSTVIPKRMRSSIALQRLNLHWRRLGFTDAYHDNVRRRGIFGQAFLLLFGTPHLGTFANGFYLRRVLRGRHFASILDAGCGDGTFTFYLASKLPQTRLLGVDIGEQGTHGIENTLEICARVQHDLGLPNLEFQCRDLRELDYENAFDFAYSFDVLEHIAENKLVLEKIYRALQKDGLFLLRIPTRVQKRVLSKRF